MNTSIDLLLLARGPLFEAAVAIFVFGVILRLTEVLMLGRRPNYAEPRGSESGPGFSAIFTRMLPDREKLKHSPAVTILGYLFHVGFFVALLFFAPHIELLHSALGLYWPALPNYVVDAAAVVTMFALVGLFVNRLVHPVLKLLSTFEDFFLLVVCFLVIFTGYLAYHRLIQPYPDALAWHILSAELLLVVFPFTKLMHAFTLFIARWYNGAMAGRKGVES